MCVVYVHVCDVYVHVYVVCVSSPRWLDDSNFGAISRGSGVFAADGLSSTHTGHTLEPAMPLPIGSKRCFCRGFVSGSIHRRPATFTPRWTPPVNTTLSPHPLGSLDLAAGPYRHHGHKWLRLTVRSIWRALMAIFTAKVPGSHSPHPFDSLSALVTGPKLLPGSCPMPFGARSEEEEEEEEEVCACVCCVCTCV